MLSPVTLCCNDHFIFELQTLPQDDHSGGTNALVEKLMTQNAELMGKVG